MSVNLDAKDKLILNALQHNARLSNASLAEKATLSDTPCLRRVKRLQDTGVISGYHAALDRAQVDLSILVYAFIKLSENTATAAHLFEQHVESEDQVISCSVISGSHDYLLEIVAKDLPSYEQFAKHQLGACKVISGIESTIVLKQTFAKRTLPIR
ncbi:Lrp/AsnC family transcriptional regulator [Pseudoalteromonas maricaloris]|uniref:Lrp/AsnC family transcriptional regulator n=1 Tax=Pseudoalteromonas maricaloris TaxID=184924 RepID=UPI00029A02DD|nr:Lrp/AsnC family transcriptional regulator [Pseudoalteromonas flavipulchra]